MQASRMELVYKYGIDGYDNGKKQAQVITTIVTSAAIRFIPCRPTCGMAAGSGNSNESSFGNLTIAGSGSNVALAAWLGRPGSASAKHRQPSSADRLDTIAPDRWNKPDR